MSVCLHAVCSMQRKDLQYPVNQYTTSLLTRPSHIHIHFIILIKDASMQASSILNNYHVNVNATELLVI